MMNQRIKNSIFSFCPVIQRDLQKETGVFTSASVS